MYDKILEVIRQIYGPGTIELHEPRFIGNEKKYLAECIDSGFVSSVGAFVTLLENRLAEFTGSKHAICVVNGTCALHLGLFALGVEHGDEVLTQSFNFIGTANAIRQAGANPVFLDIDPKTLGLSVSALKSFLSEYAEVKNGKCINRKTGRTIKACVPVHIYGHMVEVEKILELCNEYQIPMLEDAAEAIGTYFQSNGKKQHAGTFGQIGALSFNGNKTITSGGGGALLTQSDELAKKLKHFSTTAKVAHAWKYEHDAVGFNYRMPNINAALLCAQLEQLPYFLEKKREVASHYAKSFKTLGIPFIDEPAHSHSNYWLNAFLLKDKTERDTFVEYAHKQGVKVRTGWGLLPEQTPYQSFFADKGEVAKSIYDRLVCLPSSVPVKTHG